MHNMLIEQKTKKKSISRLLAKLLVFECSKRECEQLIKMLHTERYTHINAYIILYIRR